MNKNHDYLNYNKLDSFEYYKIKDKSTLSLYKSIALVLKSSIFQKYYIDDIKVETNFLFVKTQNREDYNYLYYNIYNQCRFNKYDLKLKKKLTFNIFFVRKSLLNIKLFFRYVRKYSFLKGTYLYLKSITIHEILRIIKKIDYKKIVIFSDIQPIENAIVQYSNKMNKESITLQHGLYVDYSALPNINMLNYIDVSSKYLLAWGESTKKIFEKYNKNINVVICGKPINVTTTINQKGIIGVIFDQPMFHEFNEKMLEIANNIAVRLDYKVIIKSHPQDEKGNYQSDSKNFVDIKILESAEIILAHTSSLIFDLLRRGYNVYKLKSEIPTNEIHDDLLFESDIDLYEKIFKEKKDFSHSKSHILYIGEDSKKCYEDFFTEINDDQ